jgi:uncharacterized cupredoxin-like copper-binding protein
MSDERTDPRLGVPQWVVLLMSVAAYAFACDVEGHSEAGMRGIITLRP